MTSGPVMAVLAILVSAQALCAQEAVQLKIRIEDGTTLQYAEDCTYHRSTTSLLTENSDFSDYEEHRVIEVEIQGREELGLRLKRRTCAVAVKGRAAKMDIDYDSGRGDPVEDRWESPAFSASHLVGKAYTLVLDECNQVVALRDFDEIVNAVTAALPDSELVEQILSWDFLKAGAEEMFPPLPRWRARIGFKWSVRTLVPASMGVRVGYQTGSELVAISLERGLPVAQIRTIATPVCCGESAESLAKSANLTGRVITDFLVSLTDGAVLGWKREGSMRLEVSRNSGGATYSMTMEFKSTSNGKLTARTPR